MGFKAKGYATADTLFLNTCPMLGHWEAWKLWKVPAGLGDGESKLAQATHREKSNSLVFYQRLGWHATKTTENRVLMQCDTD